MKKQMRTNSDKMIVNKPTATLWEQVRSKYTNSFSKEKKLFLGS